MRKREFIKTSLLGAAGIVSVPLLSSKLNASQNYFFEAMPVASEFTSIKGFMTKSELSDHHLNYYQNSARSLNKINLNGHKARAVFKNASLYDENVLQQTGAFYNHRIFFKALKDGKNTTPEGKVAKLITNNFGSLEILINEFINASIELNCEGWLWLVLKNNKLQVVSTKQNDNPLMTSLKRIHRGFPLLAIDMWNHAYFSSFGNNKARYINSFFNVVNWSYISKRYTRAKNTYSLH